MSLLSSRSTIKAIILSASVSDSLLQTSVALSANRCSVIKVAALLLADGYPAGHQSIEPWPALAAVTQCHVSKANVDRLILIRSGLGGRSSRASPGRMRDKSRPG